MATGAGTWKDVHTLKAMEVILSPTISHFFAYAVVRSKQSTVDATIVHVLYSCVCVGGCACMSCMSPTLCQGQQKERCVRN